MNKIKKLTYILPMLFLGLIIGGAIVGNKAAWVSGLILLIADILIGIILEYITRPNISSGSVLPRDLAKQYNSLIARTKKIFNDENATAYFAYSELVSIYVNLLDAMKNLTSFEYHNVNKIFDHFSKISDQMLLNMEQFINVVSKMIAHFDLVAPYEKCCGDSNQKPISFIEDMKTPYRNKAKIILEKMGCLAPIG